MNQPTNSPTGGAKIDEQAVFESYFDDLIAPVDCSPLSKSVIKKCMLEAWNARAALARAGQQAGEAAGVQRYSIDSKGLPFFDASGPWVAYADLRAKLASAQEANDGEYVRGFHDGQDKTDVMRQKWNASEAEFKNFHRLLCERFGYTHDRLNWKRDQLSLIEHVAGQLASAQKDAERYQWLRMCDWFDGPLCVLRDPKRVLTKGVGLGADCPSRERLDAAIDAQLTTSKGSDQ